MTEKLVGQVTFGTKVALEVLDRGNGWVVIRYPDKPDSGLEIPSQAAHVLADVLRDVEVKYE